ncbi:MAG TPA: MATE family efflux transporter [Candidatus Humimicrobiaceae bacterium]|jgi:putative MATE family efflux protein
MKSKRELLLNGNINSLLFKFSAPAIIGMVTGALYNITDTIFVGKGVGSLAIAALSIVLPIQFIIMGIGTMIGVGTASIISRALGRNKKDIAQSAFGNAFILNLMISVVCMTMFYAFMEKLLVFFGASAQVLPYAREYAYIILIGFIFLSFSISSNSFIRAEGNPRAAMYVMAIGAVLNIILDPIFIFVFDMGVKGAAIATVISQAISTIYVFLYIIFGGSVFKLKLSVFKIKVSVMKEILLLGFPSFISSATASIIILIFNRLLLFYGSDLYIAIMGIGLRMLSLIQMPLLGITQGFCTIAGFNYGAKLYPRVKKLLVIAVGWTVAIAGSGFLVMMIFPAFVISFFSNDVNLISKGTNILRIVIICFPFIGVQMLGGGLFQAMGKAAPALILTMSRQVLFLIPAAFLLPLIFGLNGVWLSVPVSDFLSIAITTGWILREIKNFNKIAITKPKIISKA